MGIATYTQTPIETQVPDFSVEIPPSLDVEHPDLVPQVLDALLDAIEIASLAGGCRRVVLIPLGGPAELARRGYVCVNEGCGGSWMESHCHGHQQPATLIEERGRSPALCRPRFFC